MLIEAANSLPAWLNPETSENRSFVHGGRVHNIPLPQTPAEISILPGGQLKLSQAVDIVRSALPTEASQAVQGDVGARIRGFPLKAREMVHRASCLVPVKVAHLLAHCPQLVAPAVEAFTLRDPIGLRACVKMANFPPADTVLTTVRLTRHLFAQLASQEFFPPKPFKLPPRGSPDFKAADLGMKLACGFEIVMTDRFYQVPDTENPEEVASYPFSKNTRWGDYLQNLEERGYFRGERPGSARYQQLEFMAKRNFLQFEAEARGKQPLVYSDPVRMIRNLLEIPVDETKLVSTEQTDQEKWLELSPEEFERLIQEQQDKMQGQGDGDFSDDEGDDDLHGEEEEDDDDDD